MKHVQQRTSSAFSKTKKTDLKQRYLDVFIQNDKLTSSLLLIDSSMSLLQFKGCCASELSADRRFLRSRQKDNALAKNFLEKI
jgi:hypothetical protein